MLAGLDRSRLKIAALLFFCLNFFFLLLSSGWVRTLDEVTLAFEVESVATHATTAIPETVNEKIFYGKYDRFGRPQGPYGLGNAALVAPWYWVGRVLTAISPGMPANKKPTLFAFMVASSASFSALAAAFAFLTFLQLGIGTRRALAAALILALATPLFSYSSWFYSEPLAAALLLGATFFLFADGLPEPLGTKTASIVGFLLGVLLWVRATNGVVIPVFLAAALLRGPRVSWRAVLGMTAIIGVFGAAYLLRNQYLFGSPLDFGYPEYGEGGKSMLGFDTPLLTGLRIFLLSPGKSIFLFAPVLFLAAPGIVWLAKRDHSLAIIAAGVPVFFLLLFSRYSHPEGCYSYGPRYMVPAIAVGCLGLGPMLAGAGSWIRRVALALFLAGFVIQGIGIATSFGEDIAPGVYYDENWAYRTDYSPIPQMTRQLLHYLTSPSPAPLGHGFDRWFLFLAKIGVPRGFIATGVVFELAGLAFFVWKLRKAVLEVSGERPASAKLDESVPALSHSL